jgi:hypothetical protein
MTVFRRLTTTALASFGLVAGFGQTAAAQELSAPVEMDALFACQTELDNAQRLACFDQAVNTLQAASTSGDIVAISRDDVEDVERDAFGFNLPSLPRLRGILGLGKSDSSPDDEVEANSANSSNPEPLDRVMLQVDRWETFNRGRYRFHLTNGQVWIQTESDALRRPRKDENGALHVEIRKASFGSFLLKVNGKGRSVRVRRVE